MTLQRAEGSAKRMNERALNARVGWHTDTIRRYVLSAKVFVSAAKERCYWLRMHAFLRNATDSKSSQFVSG